MKRLATHAVEVNVTVEQLDVIRSVLKLDIPDANWDDDDGVVNAMSYMYLRDGLYADFCKMAKSSVAPKR